MNVAVWLGVGGATLCVVAVVLAASGAPANAAFGRGLLEFLVIGTPFAVGLDALHAPLTRRFGFALLVIAYAWSLTALAESSSSVPYTLGRLAAWLPFPCIVYLLVAFPDGRVAPGLDRALLAGVVTLAATLFYATAPLLPEFPHATPWATCTTDCPANALLAVDHVPAFMSTLILVREWFVELIWLGLFVSMLRRYRAASRLRRRTLQPVFAAAVVLGVLHIAFYTSRQLGAPAGTVETLGAAWTFSIVLVCAALGLGLVRRRMLLGVTLARLGAALHRCDDLAQARDVLATTLDDPTVDLIVRDERSGAWHDASGAVAAWPSPLSPGCGATALDDADGGVVILHDIALRDDPEALDAVRAVVLARWRHDRLASELGCALADLEESRRRIAEAADLERARIERDLHDGAQQRLFALRIKLRVIEERLTVEPTQGADMVRELGFEAEQALEELRSLAHGVYPSLLTDRGLTEALRALARQAPLPVYLESKGVTRLPIEIESAVYFTCVEALHNATKHAEGATGVWISLRGTPNELLIDVCDDGVGFAGKIRYGHGLRNMRDRVEAVGGRLAAEDAAGGGARLRAGVALP